MVLNPVLYTNLLCVAQSGASDKLDLRIDGSIELGPDWPSPAVGKVISKLGQSLRQNDRAVNKNKPKIPDYNKDWFDTRQIKKTGNIHQYKHDKLHKHDDLKVIRQNDRTVNENNPKIPDYNKDWFNPRQIEYTNNDRLQKHKDKKLNKHNDFKFIRQDDRAVNVNNPKNSDYNKDWFDTKRIRYTNITNNDGLQKHKHDKLHKKDDFKYSTNDWSQQHKDDKLHGHDDFKYSKNDWIQQHKDDMLHKEDDFKYTNNIQQDKHEKLHKHDDFKFIRQDERAVIENNPKVPDYNKDWFDTKQIRYTNITNNDGLQKHKHDKLHKKDDFKHSNNDWIQQHEDDKLHTEDDFKFSDNDWIQQHKDEKLHKHDDFKYSTKDWIQQHKDDKLHKEDDFQFIGNDWNQQFKDDKSYKQDDLKDKIVFGSDNNDKISVDWDPDKFDFDDDNERSEKSDKRANPRRKRHKDGIVGVTQLERTKTTDHKVKDDGRTKEFSVHMFKQTMQVFESIKRKMGNDVMRTKVDEMAGSYKDQFADFVRQQRENSVRTKMGDQRAILHTMDTSNLILQRLVNFLKADMEKANIERSHDSTLQKEVDAARELEYKHVCTKYGYCRSDRGFTNMLQNCIKVLISVDDEKMYRARDAVTEVLKTGDYSNLIDSKTDKSFRQKINRLEKKEPEDLREALRVLLGMLQNLQTPLEDEGGNSEVVKKTAAFYTLFAMWEDNMPGDESNKLEWTDIERSLGDWRDGKRTDIHEIIKALERNVNRGLKKMDPDTGVKMKEQIKIIRG